MPNTTNYSFPTPADTDLVKNGADAIRDLGDAVDTAMNTALGTKKSGLVLLNTTTFSGVASQSLNNIFSATYTNYKIVGVLALAGNNDLLMRLRVSGSDNTGGDYSSSGYKIVGGAGAFTVQAATSSFLIYDQTSNSPTVAFEMVFYQPFVADQTYGTSFSVAGEEAGGGVARSQCISFFHNNTLSFDGFTMLGNGSNISGTINVYGFNA